MALRCQADGAETDMAAYFAYGEWAATEGFEKTPLMEETYRHYHVLQCPWCTAWAEAGLAEYGQYYCRTVDRSILRGFNPALELDLPAWHSMPGGECCDFHWKDAPHTEAFDQRVAALAAKRSEGCVKDFLYHTAHLYQTMTRVARTRDAGKGRAVEARACRDFAGLCSHQELLRILAHTEGDFTKA